MGLYERLIGLESPKIPVHQFMSALGEWERGKATRAQVISAANIQAAEEADLDALYVKIVPPPDSISIGSMVTLTNVGTSYDSITASKALGFAYVQAAGLSKIEGKLRVNKVGSGTQSWQLWNETAGVEVFVADDAGAAGEKELTGSRTFDPPLDAGLHVLRMRCKSTTAADDPIFYGCGLILYRAGQMRSVELHEVLCLAEKGWAYTNIAALKTRLGVS